MSDNNTPDVHGPTPEQARYLARLDEAAADLVDLVRDHLAVCGLPGLCVGEIGSVVSTTPRNAIEDMLCQLALREANYRGKTAPYVHRILDAWISGDPLDFERAYVPDDVRDRIVVAVEEGRVRVRPGDPE